MKTKMKMKNRSHSYDINRRRSKYGHKHINIKNVSVWWCLYHMLICIKQHVSNIWSSIHQKVKQHWGWVEKKALLTKNKLVILCFFQPLCYCCLWNKCFESGPHLIISPQEYCKHQSLRIKLLYSMLLKVNQSVHIGPIFHIA